jgi:hypothetical protein
MSAAQPSSATSAGVAGKLRDMRTDPRHHREQDSAAAARPEQTVRRIADQAVIHRQRSPAWPASLIGCSRRWSLAWMLGRYRQPQFGLGELGQFMDVEPGRRECAVKRLRCCAGFAWLIGRQHADELSDAAADGVFGGLHVATSERDVVGEVGVGASDGRVVAMRHGAPARGRLVGLHLVAADLRQAAMPRHDG